MAGRSTTPIVDCHTHSRYSDGSGELVDVVRAAAQADCKVLALTDHLTLPYDMDPLIECSVGEGDLAARAADGQAAIELGRELGVTVVYGYECDWYEGCEPLVQEWSRGATFRLGSTHWVLNGWVDNVDDLHVWDEHDNDAVRLDYVNRWCDACNSKLHFDSMAHPDLYRRFVRDGQTFSTPDEPLWDRMVDCAASTGVHIEVSTGGLRKSLAAYYPAPGLLERFCRAGVPITVGSDAHRPCDVCWGIRDAYAYARAAGYTSVDAPDGDGGWQSFELD